MRVGLYSQWTTSFVCQVVCQLPSGVKPGSLWLRLACLNARPAPAPCPARKIQQLNHMLTPGLWCLWDCQFLLGSQSDGSTKIVKTSKESFHGMIVFWGIRSTGAFIVTR